MAKRVIADVLEERARQDAKWGEQNHDILFWLAVLMEEVGEAAAEAQRIPAWEDHRRRLFREEMVQVAAVAVAILECLDRNH